MLPFPRALVLPLLALLATACGSGGYKTTKIKDYRLALVQGPSELKRDFRQLVDDFNQQAGLVVLTYVDDPAQANSAIIITEGLHQRDGKVGWGQWMSERRSENPLSKMPGESVQRTIEYSMRLEFDAEYFRARHTETDSKAHYEKQKLFFHETGHGLEMDHNPGDQTDLMYPDIAGDKDFPRFFERVRNYMRDQ